MTTEEKVKKLAALKAISKPTLIQKIAIHYLESDILKDLKKSKSGNNG